MMMRPVVCLLVFLLSVASLCMEANAFTNEPNGTAGDGKSEWCTFNDSTRTVSCTGNVFTTLYKEEVIPCNSDSAESSKSCGKRVPPEKQTPSGEHNSVQLEPEVVLAGELLSATEETSSHEKQDAGKDMDQEKITRADSPSAEDGRGGDSVDNTSAHHVERSDSTDGAIKIVEEQSQTPQGNQDLTDKSTTANSTPTHQSSAAAGTPATEGSHVIGNADSTANTTTTSTTEEPTTTPSLVPNAEISSIAPIVQKNKGNVDSSVNPVWMGTAAPLLIVAVLFSATV
ncbi:uncharacterized protein TM35_000561040 [Trypanosoma theileri]|uniref:Mucin-like glycoprotein n=1 Tax=Trypanosoma theileri TaxID=67003 RepID=A0A1X0NGH0_9TRYP|nr:uncharacterized protein TM35_000561040 [Trypanosoma theileri]ORC83806.1 hypothetical protein TM35_000561040 [Trypanosoma theileri]